MLAKSIKGSSPSEINIALKASLSYSSTDDPAGRGFKPTLAIVFISVGQDRNAICEILSKEGIDVFGATSCGEFIDGFQSEGAIAILLLDVSRDAYSILFNEIGDETVEDTARKLAESALLLYINPSLLLCSTGVNTKGEYFDGQTFVKSLQQHLGDNRLFFGGMAGDDMTFTGSYVFTNEKETDFGIAAIVFDADKISMEGMAITGWKPMGITRTVTRSIGNLVYTIDHKPGVDMYLQYLGREINVNDHSFNLMQDVSMYYPFLVERSTGETFLHTPLKIDEKEKALEMDVPMPEGTRFWFSMPPDFDIVDKVLHDAESIQKGSSADALLVFSCAGRVNVLGPMVQSENEGLHLLWNAPMAGFFTYGEFGRDSKNNQEFHSGACCWVALKEKY